MKYTVYHGDTPMFIPGSVSEVYAVVDPELELELNTAGTFTCTVPPQNGCYDALTVLRSIITVYTEDGSVYWRGRIIDIERDFYGNRKITAEGELSYFSDYYEPSFERYGNLAKWEYMWKGTVMRFWELLTDHYNFFMSQDPDKLIDGIEIDPAIQSKRMSFEQKSFTSAWDMIRNVMLEKIGGYVWIEWRTDENGAVKRILHHSMESGELIGQTIEFGKNMVDLNEVLDGTAVYTAIIAEGPNSDSGVPYTLRSSDVPASDRDAYRIAYYRLYSTTAVNIFGVVEHYEKFEEATNYANLYSLAKDRLDRALQEAITLTIEAADLSYIDEDMPSFALGCLVECISKPHELDAPFRLSKMTIPLDLSGSETYTFGIAASSITSVYNSSASKVETVSRNALTVRNAGKVSGSSTSTATGFINIGDELILAYGYVSGQSVGTQESFGISYTDAGFKSTPVISVVPCCTAAGGEGAVLSCHVTAVGANNATVSVTKNGGTNTVGLMWIAIGY